MCHSSFRDLCQHSKDGFLQRVAQIFCSHLLSDFLHFLI
jgi:hypothetical protein